MSVKTRVNGRWILQSGGVAENGKDGYTPVKGTDYFTDDDKEALVNQVLATLQDGDEVSY